MKAETFRTIERMIEDDPLTDHQKQVIWDARPTYLTTKQVSKMLNLSMQTVRKLPIPRVKISIHNDRYRLSDVNKYLETQTEV